MKSEREVETVQDRILGAWPALEVESAKEMVMSLRRLLKQAYDDGKLRTAQDGIYEWVKLAKEPEADEEIRGGLLEREAKAGCREPDRARLVRDDGAWIHFTIRVRQVARKKLDLVAYDFEIVFLEPHQPSFFRVDLNPPGHPNETREIRSHAHPGNDELQWPAPVMTPLEILGHLVYRLRPRDPAKPRQA